MSAEAGDVRSYGQYCPIARGAEIFTERWAPLIIAQVLPAFRTAAGSAE